MPKNVQTTAQLLSSLASNIMLKILQVRLQMYISHGLPYVQAGFRKGRGTRDQVANIRWIIKKIKRIPEKHLFLLYGLCQAFDLIHIVCGSPQTVKNSSRDGNTRPSYQPPEKSIYRPKNNS